MNESFEQMALRVAHSTKEYSYWTDADFIEYATRIRDELCKEPEPAGYISGGVKELGDFRPLQYHPAPIFPHCEQCGSSAWFCTVCHPAPIPADMVLVPIEPTEEMIDAGDQVSDCYGTWEAMIAAYEKETGK